jgi:hypothetical protein
MTIRPALPSKPQPKPQQTISTRIQAEVGILGRGTWSAELNSPVKNPIPTGNGRYVRSRGHIVIGFSDFATMTTHRRSPPLPSVTNVRNEWSQIGLARQTIERLAEEVWEAAPDEQDFEKQPKASQPHFSSPIGHSTRPMTVPPAEPKPAVPRNARLAPADLLFLKHNPHEDGLHVIEEFPGAGEKRQVLVVV